ncbi:TPA: hypothetical protein ACF5RG_003327 [Providencia alcalifaciens]
MKDSSTIFMRGNKLNNNVFSLNQELGSYLNGYFRLTINTDNDDFKNLNEDEWCTYIHEYTHFLQNMTTTYGLFILSAVTRSAHLVTYNIANSGSGDANKGKPYEKINFSDELMEQQNQLESMITCTLGENGSSLNAQEINTNTSFYVLKGFSESNFDEDVTPLIGSKKINVVYEHSISKSSLEIEFGAVCIYECMAVLIEEHIGKKNNLLVPIVPYMTAKDLAAYLCGEPVSDMLVCIVCELSLQSRCPGEDFVNLFKAISSSCTEYDENHAESEVSAFYIINNNYKLARKIALLISEKYKYNMTEHDGLIVELNKETLKKKYLNIVKEDFESFIGGGLRSGISDLVKYILDGFNKDIDLIFISDFMNKSDVSVDKFNELLTSRGTPLLFNNNGLVGHYLPEKCHDEHYLYLSILNDYYNSIRRQGHSCSHYSTCQKEKRAVNDNCLNNTIAKANEDPLCPLGFLIKTYGMNL